MTCTHPGQQAYPCERCGKNVNLEIIPAPWHDISEEPVVIEESTCQKAGTRVWLCKRCGEVMQSEKLLLAPHVLPENYVINSAPTCVLVGVGDYICEVCHECVRKEIIPPTGHTPAAAVRENLTNATCTGNGSYEEVEYCAACGEELSRVQKTLQATGHSWDGGRVTKAATENAAGTKLYTYTKCGSTRTESIPKLEPKESSVAPKDDSTSPADNTDTNTPEPETDVPTKRADQEGSDGTALGEGASAEAAEAAITALKVDTDPEGAKFAPLKLKSTKQTKTSVTLSWTKIKKAKKYVIYGNKCGKGNKPKKLSAVSGKSKKVTKIAGKKIKKGTYYKFLIVALDANDTVVSTSKLIHVATPGGKVGNHKSVSVKKSVITKAKKLKKGKTLKLKVQAVAKDKKLKVRKHTAVRYESSNTKVATVSKTGTVKGVKKGSCYVYAFAQNGVSKKIKIVVK